MNYIPFVDYITQHSSLIFEKTNNMRFLVFGVQNSIKFGTSKITQDP